MAHFLWNTEFDLLVKEWRSVIREMDWQTLENWKVTLGVTRPTAQQEVSPPPLPVCPVPALQSSLLILSFLTFPVLWMEPAAAPAVTSFANRPRKSSVNGSSATSSGWYLRLLREKNFKPLIYIDIFMPLQLYRC